MHRIQEVCALLEMLRGFARRISAPECGVVTLEDSAYSMVTALVDGVYRCSLRLQGCPLRQLPFQSFLTSIE